MCPTAHPNCRYAEHFEESEAPEAPQRENVEQYQSVPRAQAQAQLGGEDGGRQRAALINSGVITDDVDLDGLYHAKVIMDADDSAYSIKVGEYDGVRVRVIFVDGEIANVCPDYDQDKKVIWY